MALGFGASCWGSPDPEPPPMKYPKRSQTLARAPVASEVATRPSLIQQPGGRGAPLSGGVPGHKGANQYTDRQRAQEIRGQLIGQLEGAAKDLSALLETARESDGDRLRCKNCGSFIPGISKLKLGDILAVIRELRAILPAQYEHEGLPPIQVTVVGGAQVVPNLPPDEE